MLWLIPACAALIAAALLIYKHFVTDRIMDGGDMENPFLKDGGVLEALPENCSLRSLHWVQNQMSYDGCFSFSLSGGPDEAVIECSFSEPDSNGYVRFEASGDDGETDSERKSLSVSPERWEQVESLLKTMVLPIYEPPEPGLSDAGENRLTVEYVSGDGTASSAMLDGSSADELYTLLTFIAREAV